MKSDTFAELVDSMKEALEHAKGQRSLRTTTLPRPPAPFNGQAVKRVRTQLHASQAVFAGYLNVSSKLVQAWEAGRRRPEGPALVLLHIAASQPGVIETIRHATPSRRSRRRSPSKTYRHAPATR
jgi:putative transcriptional regulator